MTLRRERKRALLACGVLGGPAIGAGLGIVLNFVAAVIPPWQLSSLWLVLGVILGALSGLLGGLATSVLASAFASAARAAGIRPVYGVATGAWLGSSGTTMFIAAQLLTIWLPAAIIAAVLAGTVGALSQVGVWTGWRPASCRRAQSVSA